MLKKLFTIDDFAIAFVSAMACGYSETISKLLGVPGLVSMGISLVLGMVLEEILGKIIFSRDVQENSRKRFLIYGAIILLFLAAHAYSMRWMGVSMVDYVMEEFEFVIGLPILGFLVNLLLRGYRIHKIRKLYGDGNEGFVFDVEKEEMEEFNRPNRVLSGEYDTECAVKTRTGIYVGKEDGKVMSYLGIPYAKPPVKELRWKAPEPLPASETVYEAASFGPSVMQVDHKGSILKYHRQSEDCLYLNIFVNGENTEEKKPVLMLFHNGDFAFGGTADPLLHGDQLVDSHPDVIYVSFNYRLGIFGFIDFSEVPGGEAYPDALNLGLLDQIAALKWVRENIAAFGGDPDRITVMGFGSGAASICLLAAAERAKGLFQKALVFFGSPESAYDTPEPSRALAKDLLKATKTATMAELMQLNKETLKNAAQKLWKNMAAPTCDGTLIPADVYRAYQEGAASGIDFIFGIPNDERLVFRSYIGNEKYDSRISEKARLFEQETDEWMYRCAEKLSAAGNKVHLLYWDEKPLIENLGSGSVDVAAVFLGNDDALQIYGSVLNKDLSEVLQTLLVKYMNGSPLELYPNEIRGVDAIDWEAFPKALIVSDGMLSCDTIKDRISGEPK